MRPASGERSWDANDGSITATEDIALLLPTARTQSDDYPVGTNARPPETPLVFASTDAARNTEALDDLLSRPQTPRHINPPPQQTNNNAQAQSGGGGVPGGASTPNAGGGGGGAGSSGAGPAVTNASQFLSAYLNMVDEHHRFQRPADDAGL